MRKYMKSSVKNAFKPSIDLVSRLKDRKFKRILDTGCGTGMSTAVLVSAFGNAEIIGADLSEEMLAKATKSIIASYVYPVRLLSAVI